MAIHFFKEDCGNFLLKKRNVSRWIKNCINKFESRTGDINYIFCSDEYLKNINIQYLKHDYFTDIITFNYSENKVLNADIYISIDRVKENALKFEVGFELELYRVMVHGILHLIGLNDHTKDEKLEMRKAEDYCLSLFVL